MLYARAKLPAFREKHPEVGILPLYCLISKSVSVYGLCLLYSHSLSDKLMSKVYEEL